tara:strand:+ start:1043 stop:1735 length:693 start_codon:yes stop_codon:yes gene_type:complete
MVIIDTVYQRVLALANKEQRGYITPQEFNLFAEQAQLEILEQYFYDINQFGRLHGNDTEYSDMLNLLDEKLAPFRRNQTLVNNNGTCVLPGGLYKLGSVRASGVEVEMVNPNELTTLNQSPLTQPRWETGMQTPVYTYGNNQINITPFDASQVITITFLTRPDTPYWGYVVVDGKAMYNPGDSINFALHATEEAELVNRILALAGITIKQPDIVQAATQFEGAKQSLEKR